VKVSPANEYGTHCTAAPQVRPDELVIMQKFSTFGKAMQIEILGSSCITAKTTRRRAATSARFAAMAHKLRR
jgi:hypothetical protein